MSKEYLVIRDVTPDECEWIDHTILKDTRVYEYRGATYGCCTDLGLAVTLIKNKTPFFEVPLNSLEEIK